MKLVLLVMLLATAALADIPPPQPATGACVGKTAGASCSATGGRCVTRQVRRPDFSTSPPTWAVVDVLLCEEPASSYTFAWVLAAVGGVLALLGRQRWASTHLTRTARAGLRG